ncbi:MAG: lipoate--protein ligase [Chloroflexota bacterium]|nr:lipoate--protein ligase [Chloroflexota bacterium]
MIYIETNSLDPTWNLAFEEYCLKELTQYERIMLLWQNDNAIIIGRYQNAEKEVNLKAAKALGTQIVRRPSGGGAVFHDMGNLNYTFIYPIEGLNRLDFSVYAEPMVKALNKIGVPAEIRGRNDLLLDGKKVSGTAQRIYKGRLMHHGTLLYDSDLDSLENVLQVDSSKIASKGVSSIRSRVTNISEHLPVGKFENIQAFWQALLAAFAEEEPLTTFEPTPDMLAEIRTLQKEKYQSWDWNFGRAPAFEYKNNHRFPKGNLEIQVNVTKGRIQACKLSGDFMGLVELDPLEAALQDVKYHPEDVRAVLDNIDLSHYLGGITADEFIQCLFEGTRLT